MTPSRPFSQACENNKAAILAVLRDVFADVTQVLEIGSGSGQHAAWFSRHLPGPCWQPSDLPENLPGIAAWREAGDPARMAEPVALDVQRSGDWPPAGRYDGVFSANTLHIMDWGSGQRMLAEAGRRLAAKGALCVYGPFNRDGEHTSDSNARFDAWLRSRDPAQGLRDMEDVERCAARAGLGDMQVHAMPANNWLLAWKKGASPAKRR